MSNEDLKRERKNILLFSLISYSVCFLASFFCFFINQMWIPLGFLLGAIISIANFLILYEFSYYLTRKNAKSGLLSVLLYLSRMILYGLGFVICLLLQYNFNLKIFFWGTCFASYIIMTIIIVIVMSQTNKRLSKKNNFEENNIK